MVISGEIKILSFFLDSPMCFDEEYLPRVRASLTIEIDGVEIYLTLDYKDGIDVSNFPNSYECNKIEIIGNKINFYGDVTANKSN